MFNSTATRVLIFSLSAIANMVTPVAVAGVVEIDQAKVMAGFITPGDTPGFPATISQPGSYRLTGNLNVPNGVSGIALAASGITLDLGGFGIFGTGAAGGAQQHGIAETGFFSSSVITNGTVAGMGGDGVVVSQYARVTQLNVTGNGGRGIYAVYNSIVSDNVVTESGGNGIDVNRGSRVSGNIIAYGTGDGIRTTGPACIVSDNSIYQNGGDGIEIGSGGPNLVSGNTLSGNTDLSLRAGIRTGYKDNTLGANASGAAVSGGINLGHNTCDASLCP